MKSLRFILTCLIIIYFYLFSQSIGSSASSTVYPGRRAFREVQMASPNCKDPYHKIQDNDNKAKQPTVKDGSRAVQYESSTGNFDEIIYHIDYHGVTTHPTPTPKHPNP